MKLYHKIITGVVTLMAGSMAFTACTDDVKFGDAFVEKQPGGTLTIDSVFSNPEYTRQFLTGIYALQYYGLPFGQNTAISQNPYYGKLDGLTDCYQTHYNSTAIYNTYYSGTMTANLEPLISFTKDYVWEAVRQSWLLIENIDRVTGLTEAEKANMVAQAK